MDVSATGSNSTQTTQARQTLSGNYDTFLKLLVSQLQNQDPLSPMDSTQFTQQLVMYSQVEQQISTNDNLDTLISMSKSAAAANAVSYLGKDAVTSGNLSSLDDGSAKWRYVLPQDAATVTISVVDSNGKTVFTQAGEKDSGDHEFVWDGKSTTGEMLAEGTYKLTIVAKDASAKTITPTISGQGVVNEIDMSGAEATALIGNRSVLLSDILAVR